MTRHWIPVLFCFVSVVACTRHEVFAAPDDLIDVEKVTIDNSLAVDELLLKAKDRRAQADKAVSSHGQNPYVEAEGAAYLQAAIGKLKPDDARIPKAHQELAEMLVRVGKFNQQTASIRHSHRGDDKEHPNVWDDLCRKQWRTACEHYSIAEKHLERDLQQTSTAKEKPDQAEPSIAESWKMMRHMALLLDHGRLQQVMARSYGFKSQEGLQLLRDAMKLFVEAHERYSMVAGGGYAKMHAGQCRFDLGATGDAAKTFEEILAALDNPESYKGNLRDSLEAHTLRELLNCYIHSDLRRYDDAITRGEAWLAKRKPRVVTASDEVFVRWPLAQAYSLRSESGKDASQAARDAEAALKHAKLVAEKPVYNIRDVQLFIQRMTDRVGAR
jgi:tetratricopeptide (TPR) repeat protein